MSADDTDWDVWKPSSAVTTSPTTGTPAAMDSTADDNETSDGFDTNVLDLAEYELIKIVSYFPLKERLVLRHVCSKWKSCVEKSFLSEPALNYRTIGSQNGITEKAVCLLIRKCCNVRHIDLKGMFLFKSILTTTTEEAEMTDNIVANIIEHCHQLQTIDLGSLEDFEDTVIGNADYFKRLKKIISQNMNEKALNCLIDSQNLESLDIRRNDRISRPDFGLLGPKITELQLTESEVIDEKVFRELCDGNGKRVRVLSVDIKESAVLSLICRNLNQLNSLQLCLYSKNCDLKLFSHLNRLNSLEMEVMDESGLKAEQFTDLVRSLRAANLSTLKVKLSPVNNIAIDDNSLKEIYQNCGSVERLVIRRANSLTGAGMPAIAQLQGLRHLDLMNCLHVTDEVEVVMSSCPRLRDMILHNCSYITKRTVDVFVEKAKTAPEEDFYLDVVDTNVSQEALPAEAERPKNLKILVEYEDCIYDCDHGWDQNGYNSGPEDDNDLIDDIDFYNEDEDYDHYDDHYDDEDLDDYEFS